MAAFVGEGGTIQVTLKFVASGASPPVSDPFATFTVAERSFVSLKSPSAFQSM